MTAISGMSLLQIVEVRWLNGVRVEVAKLWKPFAAGTVGFLVAYGVGEAIAGAPRLVLALTKLVVLAVVYLAALRALRLDPEDAELLAKWRGRARAR